MEDIGKTADGELRKDTDSSLWKPTGETILEPVTKMSISSNWQSLSPAMDHNEL